ncbi:peptide-methionine (S)-S-oxide reductase [Bdellovibrio sp. qaytius]|nr:peptide-methionine (S)-S-oxide reductase [Bdellovibrio sp. qaytius]
MSREIAVIAAGCFWGVEELLRELDGVLETEVGYCNGDGENPVYTLVKTGTTGHAEAVKITFDPDKISYADLIHKFYKLHDPTTKNQQGNDIGTQYRSAIFYVSEAQKATAEAITKEVEASGVWKKPIATEITLLKKFWSAEEYHQDYLQKNPDGYMCHFWR